MKPENLISWAFALLILGWFLWVNLSDGPINAVGSM